MMMTLLCLLSPAAWAGTTTELSLLAGARSAPEAGIERPEEWEIEVDPAVFSALLGELGASGDDGAWVALQLGAWGFVPEGEASRLLLEPRGGWFGVWDSGLELDLAARITVDSVVYEPLASSTRNEALADLGLRRGPLHLELSAVGIERTYPRAPTWSFRSQETRLDAEVELGALVRLELGLAGQLNQGSTLDAADRVQQARGRQLRLQGALGLGGRRGELGLRYRYYAAEEGELDDAVRAQFTPIGAYSDDADALSAGGFTQHRLQLTGAWEPADGWLAALSALARFRDSPNAVRASFDQTLHGQASLERELGETWSLSATGGTSSARLVDGQRYLDVYGWLGLTARLQGSARADEADSGHR